MLRLSVSRVPSRRSAKSPASRMTASRCPSKSHQRDADDGEPEPEAGAPVLAEQAAQCREQERRVEARLEAVQGGTQEVGRERERSSAHHPDELRAGDAAHERGGHPHHRQHARHTDHPRRERQWEAHLVGDREQRGPQRVGDRLDALALVEDRADTIGDVGRVPVADPRVVDEADGQRERVGERHPQRHPTKAARARPSGGPSRGGGPGRLGRGDLGCRLETQLNAFTSVGFGAVQQ